MKLFNCVLSTLILISFIILATNIEMGLVDKICKIRSDRFSGVCFSNNSCAIICQLFEKFEGGQCEFDGVFSRCLCTKALCLAFCSVSAEMVRECAVAGRGRGRERGPGRGRGRGRDRVPVVSETVDQSVTAEGVDESHGF
ncbi:PREDICTED: defensin-like protein 8 [Camelina sativa]|uniref:Defensin-like protein 8 n=1 Tax=Camelina sativa TaxID=90675 RepID=A0ABM1RRZ7_CAMSA|nr:PREDICTED: defensin-like protein 8 [Camelina sativa]